MLLSPSGLINPFDLRVTRQQVIELLFSVLIISILITVSIPIYLDCRLKAKIVHISGDIDTKKDMYVFHAVNGSWPQNNQQLKAFQSKMGFEFNDNSNEFNPRSPYVKNIFIEDGAVHFLLKEELEGKTISLRPAVPEMDETGPIILVCNKDKPGWFIAGTDKTTIDERLISRFLR